MDITKVDKNFAVQTDFQLDDVKIYDIDEAPFKVYGVFREGEMYKRLPEAVAKTVSESVHFLHSNTAGGRVKFITDSPYIAVYVEYSGEPCNIANCTFIGTAGLDLYCGERFLGVYRPPLEAKDGFKALVTVDDVGEREYTINFPTYSNVKKLYIGLKEGCVLKEAKPYRNIDPVVYYGSSVTQGGCACRPGNTYQAMITRELNVDHINLGFSGSALAEDQIAEYISGLKMSVFVYDYDHNAPTMEHYRNTHERMFKIIRDMNPELPILMMTRPQYYLNDEMKERIEIMMNTYNNAVAAGDKNVYYLTGPEMVAEVKDVHLVDSCHPNDAGFRAMANAVGAKLRLILNIED